VIKVIYDDVELEIIKLVQADLPLESRPYSQLAQKLNVNEEEIVTRIQSMKERGLIKRLGVILRHQKAGFTVNALVAWRVAENEADEVGIIIAEYDAVSHCYLREVPESFKYNLFSMIHSHSEEEIAHLIKDISNRTGIKDYIIIKSLKELKKTSMTYI